MAVLMVLKSADCLVVHLVEKMDSNSAFHSADYSDDR